MHVGEDNVLMYVIHELDGHVFMLQIVANVAFSVAASFPVSFIVLVSNATNVALSCPSPTANSTRYIRRRVCCVNGDSSLDIA